MTGHLHVPHSRLADRFIACVHEGIAEGAFDHFRHRKPRVAQVDPAVIAAWAAWKTPAEWEAEHGGREER